MASQYGLFIDGNAEPTATWSTVHDPAAPASIVGYAAEATREQAQRAVDAAARAWPAWSALSPGARAAALVQALDGLAAGYAERVDLLVRENGKVRGEAEVELGVFEWRARLAASLADQLSNREQLPVLASREEAGMSPNGAAGAPTIRRYQAPPLRSYISHLPLGVVTIIVPYNWPIAILAASLPYALVAGNPVVVKPPPTCPLALIETMHRMAAALPPGVLNVVSGSNDAVVPLLRDPAVARIVFTGSTGAGKFMMATAADTLKRVTLELGGNDPAIVLDDAQLDRAALTRLTVGSFLTSGQVCMGIKRIYVHRSRYAEVVDGMTALLARYCVGHGLAETTTMGPLNNARQREIVQRMVDEARSEGAEIRELGELDPAADRAGYFLRPTLVLDPAPDSRIVVEEQFGPALPILPYDDLDAVIAQTNSEWAGLCSSVWTSDLDRADRVAAQLRTGTTWINNANAVTQDDRAPFGGFRQSGVGRELGRDGLLEFTEAHTVTYPVT